MRTDRQRAVWGSLGIGAAAALIAVVVVVATLAAQTTDDDPAPNRTDAQPPVESARHRTAPAWLPRLTDGRVHFGLQHSGDGPAFDARYDEALAAGLSVYVASFSWAAFEPDPAAPGVIDEAAVAHFTHVLDILSGLRMYVLLKTIDTNSLALPGDLLAPDDPRRLRPGLLFDDPAVIERFGRLLDVLIPLLRDRNGAVIAIGNEVDGWLPHHPDQVEPYARFVQAARERVRRHAPEIGVVTSVMFGGLADAPAVVRRMIDVSDAAAFTYYPMAPGDFQFGDPQHVGRDLDAMIAAAGDKTLLLQEFGYPSGAEPTPTIGASLDRQREFYTVAIREIAQRRDAIGLASALTLTDWPPDAVDGLVDYYGVADPRFAEFLGTLGLLRADATPKPAFRAFVDGVAAAAAD
jgi:hypothetical protein